MKENFDSDIANALIEASEYLRGDDKKRLVKIKRGDRELFSFEIQPISEDTLQKARRQNLKSRGRREELDGSRFVSQIIYDATIDKSLWQNKAAQVKLNVASPVDLINAVLKPAEKTRLEEILMQISGFSDDDSDDLVSEIKNE